MAIRRPVYLFADTTLNPVRSDIYEYNDSFMADILAFTSYVHAQDPGTKLEVNTSNGTQMANQNFTDTYYIAGASTTRVDRFSTEAETPNVSMSTDTYNRIRIIDNQGTLPTTDTSNLEYPLYLDDQTPRQLRAMTRQDFIDTFVTPALDNWLGSVANEQGGTYFLTTSANPANATIIGSVPVAINSVANLSSYSSGGIGEAVKQTTDINYWLAKVDYSEIDFDPMEDSLPMYFDAGTETLRQHSLASWTALLGPFLRYYLGGGSATHTIAYSINGSGTTQGSIFTDSRRTPTGTGYTTRFVNANDYRTQEFPTGTESTISGTEKRLKMTIGVPEAVALLGTSASPQSFLSSGPIGTVGSYNTTNGFTFTSTGNIEEKDYFYDGAQQTFSTNEWCNITPTGSYWIRFTDDTAATSGGTSRVPATGQNFEESGSTATYWRILQDIGNQWVDLIIYDNGVQMYYNRRTGPNMLTDTQAITSKYVGNRLYYRGTVESTYTATVNYGIWYTEQTSTRVTPNTGSSFGTWLALTADRSIYWNDTSAPGTYASYFSQVKVEIADDSAGNNILDTGYYSTSWHGDQAVQVQLPSTMFGTANSNGLSGSCSAYLEWNPSTGTLFISGFGNPGSGTGTVSWLSAGALAGDYEVRFTYTVSLTGSGGTSGSYTNTSSNSGTIPTSGGWYSAAAFHKWRVTDSGTPASASTISGTVEIREQSSSTVLATSTVSLSANNNP